MTTNLNRLALHGRDADGLWWFCRRGEPLGPYHCIGRGLRELRARFEGHALDDTMTGFICTATVYEFEGLRFEFGGYCGPYPLDDNGDPVNEEPTAAFWSLIERFEALQESEREACRVIRGGCIPFEVAR